MERYEQLYTLLQEAQEDFRKFYELNNKAAGTRVRKGMLEFKKLAQEIRVEVQNRKSTM